MGAGYERWFTVLKLGIVLINEPSPLYGKGMATCARVTDSFFMTMLLVLLGSGGVGVGVLYAEKVNMRPAELRKTATHVIVGEVAQIYERMEASEEWNTTYYLAEVRIKNVEKGEGIKADELVYVRYWHRERAPNRPIRPSTNGHRGLPAKGETLRIYLARNAYHGFGMTNDGGFDVIGANGFEKL